MMEVIPQAHHVKKKNFAWLKSATDEKNETCHARVYGTQI